MLRLIRLPDVIAATGMGKGTIYKRIRAGLFPKPITFGERFAAWPESEVAAMNAALIRGDSEEKLSALVKQLEKQRQQAAA